MKKIMENYCKNIEKKTNKLLFKMFGYKGLVEAIKNEQSLEIEIEKEVHKQIDLVTFEDVRGNSYLMINYCKYKTLKSIIDTYQDSRRIHMYSNDYIEECEKNG